MNIPEDEIDDQDGQALDTYKSDCSDNEEDEL